MSDAPSRGACIAIARGAGGRHPSAECGRQLLQRVRQCSPTAWASLRMQRIPHRGIIPAHRRLGLIHWMFELLVRRLWLGGTRGKKLASFCRGSVRRQWRHIWRWRLQLLDEPRPPRRLQRREPRLAPVGQHFPDNLGGDPPGLQRKAINQGGVTQGIDDAWDPAAGSWQSSPPQVLRRGARGRQPSPPGGGCRRPPQP